MEHKLENLKEIIVRKDKEIKKIYKNIISGQYTFELNPTFN